MVIIRTTFGEIKLELEAEKAPKTVANFLDYARDGYYDGTIFHRVIDNFMIQGGGFDTDMQQKSTSEPVENEADNGLKNDFGTVAMARTMEPHSATAHTSWLMPPEILRRAERRPDRTGASARIRGPRCPCRPCRLRFPRRL